MSQNYTAYRCIFESSDGRTNRQAVGIYLRFWCKRSIGAATMKAVLQIF